MNREHSVSERPTALTIYLTAEEVSERYRGEISVGTLANWRAARIGPTYIKIGKAVLYPLDALDEWDKQNLVVCNGSKSRTVTDRDKTG
jgi:hypothetical protein